MKNPYEILGVAKTASEADIKAAYRKLVMKYHPDKNSGDKAAEEKFKEINNAYDVLKDPQKKAAYDQFGDAAFAGGTGAGNPFGGASGFSGSPFGGGFAFNMGGFGTSMSDIIDEFMQSFGLGGRGRNANRPRDLQATVNIPFTTLALGGEVEIPGIDNKPIKVKVRAGTQIGEQIRVRGQGQNGGDLYIDVATNIPKHLSSKQKKALEEFMKG